MGIELSTITMPAGCQLLLLRKPWQLLNPKHQGRAAELDAELDILKVSGDSSIVAENVIENVLTIVGGSAPKGGPGGGQRSAGRSEVAEVMLYLAPFFERGGINYAEIRDRWREKVGTIPDALELTFVSDAFSAGDAINFEARAKEKLKIAATQLEELIFIQVYSMFQIVLERGKQRSPNTNIREG